MLNKKETTELLKQLVAIKSDYFNEGGIMAFAEKWLRGQGLPARIREYHEDKVTHFHGQNVIVELDGGAPGPVVCLNGHLDTVRLCNGWTKNPGGEIEGDRLYGVGALDMKSGCAALMTALAYFAGRHRGFRGKIKAVFVSVEEGPYGLGTNALIDEGYLDDVTVSVIAEPSAGFSGHAYPDLCLGARGGYGIDVEFFGKSAHAATPEKGISAAEDAAAFIGELKNIDFITDPKLGRGSCCVVAVSADGGACSVPDYAKVKLFRHIVVGENERTITKELRDAAARAKIGGRCEIRFREAPSEGSRGFLPYTVPADDPFVAKFAESVERVSGRKPTHSYFSSIGDFCYLGTRLNAPAIIFGAAGEHYHGKDEYAELESVYLCAETFLDFLERILTD